MTIPGDLLSSDTPLTLISVVFSLVIVLIIVVTSILPCCKTKQRKLDITETGDPIVTSLSLDPEISHHKVKDVQAVVATRSRDDVNELVAQLQSGRYQTEEEEEDTDLEPQDDSSNDHSLPYDVTEERIYEDLNELDLDIQGVTRYGERPKRIKSPRSRATEKYPSPVPTTPTSGDLSPFIPTTPTSGDLSPFIYENLDQYFENPNASNGLDNPGFSTSNAELSEYDYPAKISLANEVDYRDDLCIYDFPGLKIDEKPSEDYKPRETSSTLNTNVTKPAMYRPARRRISIVEQELLENEQREMMHLQERKLVATLKTSPDNKTPMSLPAEEHREPTSKSATIPKSSTDNPEVKKLSSSFKKRPAINMDANDSDVDSPKQDTNLKPALVNKALCNVQKVSSKPNKGSVRFKHGFDVIPDAEFVDDESIVARNIRLATERDQDTGAIKKLNVNKSKTDSCAEEHFLKNQKVNKGPSDDTRLRNSVIGKPRYDENDLVSVASGSKPSIKNSATSIPSRQRPSVARSEPGKTANTQTVSAQNQTTNETKKHPNGNPRVSLENDRKSNVKRFETYPAININKSSRSLLIRDERSSVKLPDNTTKLLGLQNTAITKSNQTTSTSANITDTTSPSSVTMTSSNPTTTTNTTIKTTLPNTAIKQASKSTATTINTTSPNSVHSSKPTTTSYATTITKTSPSTATMQSTKSTTTRLSYTHTKITSPNTALVHTSTSTNTSNTTSQNSASTRQFTQKTIPKQTAITPQKSPTEVSVSKARLQSSQDDSILKPRSRTVMVGSKTKPGITYSQTIGVQSGRLVMERELQEMKRRELEFRAMKGLAS